MIRNLFKFLIDISFTSHNKILHTVQNCWNFKILIDELGALLISVFNVHHQGVLSVSN